MHNGNRRALALTATLLIASLLLLTVFCRPATASDLKVWSIDQNCHACGNINIKIAPSAIRIDSPEQSFSVIARAPKWQVYAFSTSRKNYFSWPLDKYIGLRKDALFGGWVQDREWKKISTQRSKTTGLILDVIMEDFKPGTEYSEAEKTARIYTAPQIPASKEALRVYARTSKTPLLKVFPMDGTIYKSLFGLHSDGAYLSTKAAKSEFVKSSLFDLPAGLKQAKGDEQVTGSDNGDFSDLLPNK